MTTTAEKRRTTSNSCSPDPGSRQFGALPRDAGRSRSRRSQRAQGAHTPNAKRAAFEQSLRNAARCRATNGSRHFSASAGRSRDGFSDGSARARSCRAMGLDLALDGSNNRPDLCPKGEGWRRANKKKKIERAVVVSKGRE